MSTKKVSLGDVVEIQQAKDFDREKVWLLNLDMIQQQTGDIIEYNYIDKKSLNPSTYPFDTDNVLYSKLRPYLNKVVVPEESGYATTELLPLKPNKLILKREYLAYFLRSQQFVTYISDKVSGAKMPRVNIKDFLSTQLFLPSLLEQLHVVTLFDRISYLISLRKQQLAKFDEFVKARFVEMFGDPEINPMGWEIKTLGDLLSVEPQNGLYKPQSDYVHDGTGTPILRIDAFYDGYVTTFLNLRRLICTDSEINRYLLQKNDIVINRVNSLEYLGKCARITETLEPTVFESNIMRFHPNENEIDSSYLTRLLCSSFIYKQILNRAKKAVNQASINQGDVQSFCIIVPPLGLQTQFATFVAKVDKLKLSVQQSLAKLETLKASLMQEYFG